MISSFVVSIWVLGVEELPLELDFLGFCMYTECIGAVLAKLFSLIEVVEEYKDFV